MGRGTGPAAESTRPPGVMPPGQPGCPSVGAHSSGIPALRSRRDTWLHTKRGWMQRVPYPRNSRRAFRHAMLDQRSSPVSFPHATRPRALLYCAAACMGGRERKCGITSSPTIRYCSTIFSLGVVSGGDRLICCIPG
jgi:hypothetical protein